VAEVTRTATQYSLQANPEEMHCLARAEGARKNSQELKRVASTFGNALHAPCYLRGKAGSSSRSRLSGIVFLDNAPQPTLTKPEIPTRDASSHPKPTGGVFRVF